MSGPTPQQAKQYNDYVKQKAPKSKTLVGCVKAFLVGGLICVIGQLVLNFGKETLKMPPDDVAAFTAIVMVFLGSTLTGLGLYDRIGKFAGAGSIVPITGFANSVAAPAMEFRSEGYILGTGAKLFLLAGPVLVNGYSAALLMGLIRFLLDKLGVGAG